jgi:hypothetical protein
MEVRVNRSSWVTSIPLALCVVFSGLVYLACDDSYRSNPTGGSSGNNGGNGTGNSGSGGDVVIDVDGSVPCENICSNDGREVRNSCNDNVITKCTPDEGCLNGECIADPCKAAKDGKSSLACDYWAVKTALRPQQDGACFAAFVANTWEKNVHINVEYNGTALNHATKPFAYIPTVGAGGVVDYMQYNAVTGLPPGQVAILFLSRYSEGVSVIDCPKPAALPDETGFSGTGIGKAFHITTDFPVTAYQMVPFNGGSAQVTSATLLLPTSAWGTNYIAINAYKAIPDPMPPANPIGGYPSLVVLATEDATKVTLLPKAAIVGGPGVAAATANTPVSYMLNSGQFLQITQPAELTGSPLESDKPVGVFGASTCMRVPTGKLDCDSGQQQLPPVNALGSEYVAVRYKSRNASEEQGLWRLVGVVDGTELTWSPIKPPNAPTKLMLGEVVEFEDPGPFVVRAQDGKHPFYLGAYMTGSADFAGVGDPEWHNVVPPQQYLRRYVLFTDPTYPESSLVVVRVRSKQTKNFEPVTLKCRGEVMGWTPIGDGTGDYEWTRVNLVTGNFVNVEGCSNGPHEMSSEAPFGVTVWGWGTTQQTLRVSYAYPAGAGFKPINEIVVPPAPK